MFIRMFSTGTYELHTGTYDSYNSYDIRLTEPPHVCCMSCIHTSIDL